MDFLDAVFFDNTLRNYLIVLGTILLVLLLKRFLSQYIASLLFLLIHRTWKNIEKKEFMDLVVKPLGWMLVIMVAVFALDKLNFPDAWHFTIYGHSSDVLLEKAGACIIIISFVRFILSLVDFIALILKQKAVISKDKNDSQLIVFFRDFLKVIIGLIGVLLVIKAGFNRNIGSLLTGLSIVGAALALAAKESIENLIASFVIFFDKPFYTGDTLKVNNVTGTVERIGLRSTRIRTTEKTLVTVPNKQMVDSIVDNYSMRSERRAEMKLELAVKTSTVSVEKFIELAKNALDKNKELVKYSVFISEFNKNGIVVTIEYFTVPFSMGEFNKLKQSLIISFKRTVEELNIEMASGGADIHIFQGDGEPVPPPAKTII
jgi:MscS family membrane protein